MVSAIHGLGGIGKSVLAQALCHHDQEIRNRFSDGILWVTLGQNPEILPLLRSWIQTLDPSNTYQPTNIQSASGYLQTRLTGKQVLLVIDDVWNPEDANWFRVGNKNCCVLITTREAKISDATYYDLDVMSAEQATELISKVIGRSLSSQEEKIMAEVAKTVGYLPLALELVSAQVNEGKPFNELQEDLFGEIARLDSLDRYQPDDQPDEALRRKHSLIACFNLSLRRLTPEQLQHYAWLGVLPEDVSMSRRWLKLYGSYLHQKRLEPFCAGCIAKHS